ncbi:hypothetical protein PHMEG_0001528 [Phytophthora megakarya]|uniref:PA domain-containing protein n=1 Tax=Phytophthora megakarya TaxID=4795 RepID=A0A225X117_9STRA|nr:hypothetical protein PHMEG_0001528 [Phytophthora megakarya]
MLLANNTREEPLAAFTMGESPEELEENKANGAEPITIPCVMMCLRDVRELFKKFPPSVKTGVMNFEILQGTESEDIAEECLRVQRELYEAAEAGKGWKAIKRTTTSIIKLLDPQNTTAPGSIVAETSSLSENGEMPLPEGNNVVDVRTSREDQPPLLAFVQWATSASSYEICFAPLADFCTARAGASYSGKLVACDPLLADKPLQNAEQLSGAVALLRRGSCPFPEKLKRVQRAGAVAAIVCNDDEEDPDDAFVMSVDHIDTTNATLPAVMISHNGLLRIQSALNGATARILCLAGEAADELLASSGKPVSFISLPLPTPSQVITKDKEVDEDHAVSDAVFDLYVACRDGDHAACQRVLAGVKGKEEVQKLVNAAASSNGLTPLHHACAGGNDNVVELLLKLGAAFDAVDLAMQTPLHVACANGDVKCARLLLRAESSASQVPAELYNIDEEYGGLATKRNIGGGTAMHEAARTGSSECVELLLSANARVERVSDGETDNYIFLGVSAKDLEGNTPLHAACTDAHAECALYLNNGRLVLDRVESPDLRRDLEILYLRHESQNAKQSTMELRKENETVVKRIQGLEEDLATLRSEVDNHAAYKQQMQQLQLQMQMILQLQTSYGKHTSPGINHDKVAYPLLASSVGDATGKNEEELALDAALARDLGKKCLRQSQSVLAAQYFQQSLELMPLPGVNRLLDTARKSQHDEAKEQFPAKTLLGASPLLLGTSSPPNTKMSRAHELREMIRKTNANPQARAMLDNELKKASTISDDAEFTLACRWVEWLVALPWGDPNYGLQNDELYAMKRNEFQQLDAIDARRIDIHKNEAARLIQRTFRERYSVHLQNRVLAASRIQAVVRGKLARKHFKATRHQLVVARGERSVQLVNQQNEIGVITPSDMDYTITVDPGMQKKLPHDYYVDRLLDGRLFSIQQKNCININEDKVVERNQRVLQLVKCVKADSVIPYKSNLDKKETSFFVWTRWGTDLDKVCASTLCGPYEDQQDAQRRFDRIAREEASREDFDKCISPEADTVYESGFDFLRSIVGVGGPRSYVTSA